MALPAQDDSMSLFPWLKECGSKIMDPPIAPVNEHDVRVNVNDLIKEYQPKIDLVRNELVLDPLYNKNKHDDLWILRFLLSHKQKVKEAVKAAKFTLAFRKEHSLDASDIRYTTPRTGFAKDSLTRYLHYCKDDSLLFTLPDQTRGVVAFINIGGVPQDELVKNVPESDWLPCFMYYSEWAYQWQDYITRTTGRLTKSIRLIDARELKLTGMNRELVKRDGKVMGIMEDCYPQLLQGIYICHAPIFMQIPWRLLRPLLPKRVTSKIDFISPTTNENECRRLLQYVTMEHLPTIFGGTNEHWPPVFNVSK